MTSSLHEYIVTVAIFIFAAALAAELLNQLIAHKQLKKYGRWFLLAGCVLIISAVLSGNEAYAALQNPERVRDVVESHKLMGQIMMWLSIVAVAIRFFFLNERGMQIAYIVVLLAGAALLFRGATLGSEVDTRLNPAQQHDQKVNKPSFE